MYEREEGGKEKEGVNRKMNEWTKEKLVIKQKNKESL